MTHHFHAVVWLDHREARVFEFGGDNVKFLRIAHNDSSRHIHHKAGSVGSGHTHEDQAYLRSVADALAPAQEILLTGPAAAKSELLSWMKSHAPQTAARVLGVETLDHPTDAEIVAFAKNFFAQKDRMTSQIA